MNQTFKIGEVAIIQNMEHDASSFLNGTECTILSAPIERLVKMPDGEIKMSFGYEAQDCDGINRLHRLHQLRKKPPKSDSKEWAESKVKELIKPMVMA